MMSLCTFVGPSFRVGALAGGIVGTAMSVWYVPQICRIVTHSVHGEYEEALQYLNNMHEKIFPPYLTDVNDKKFETYWKCAAILPVAYTGYFVMLMGMAGAIVGCSRAAFNKCQHSA